MRLNNLKKASEYDFHKWLTEKLTLTDYQQAELRDYEIFRFSKYEIFETIKEPPSSFLWRITLPLIPVYILIVWLVCGFKWVITGNSYLGRKFLDNFHYKWMRKLDINL